jgi:hypothetical protein
MIRRFVTTDGEVLDESDWTPAPNTKCFFCGTLITTESACENLWGSAHDWVTLADRDNF